MQKTKRNSLWQHIYLFLVSRANSWDNENCETSCVRQDAFYLETISSCISGCLRSWSANFDVVIETLILAEQVNSWGVAQRDSHGRSQGSGNTFNIFSSPANHISLFTSKSHPYWSTLLILKWRCSPSIFHSPASPPTHTLSLWSIQCMLSTTRAKMFPLLIQRVWRLWPSCHALVLLDCLWTMFPLLLFFYLCHSVFGWNQPKIFSKFSKDSSHQSSGRWHVDKDV